MRIKLLIGILFTLYNVALAQVDTLVQKRIRMEVATESRQYRDSLNVYTSDVAKRLVESGNIDDDVIKQQKQNKKKINDAIESQITANLKIQKRAFVQLNKITSKMYKAYEDVNGDASRWYSGIILSESLSNPFSNSIVRNKWDKFYGAAKWIPGLLFTGITYATNQSSELKTISIGTTVSIAGIIDIIQTSKKKDGVNSAVSIVENGAASIDALAFYRVSLNDIQEIKSSLLQFQNYMIKEGSEFDNWYKQIDSTYLTKAPDELLNTPYWNTDVFSKAIYHISNIDKKMNSFSDIFKQVDLLINAKLTSDIFKQFAKIPQESDVQGFMRLRDDAPKIVTEIYDNLKKLQSFQSTDQKKWEEYRYSKYSLTFEEYKALDSFAELEKENTRLRTLQEIIKTL